MKFQPMQQLHRVQHPNHHIVWGTNNVMTKENIYCWALLVLTDEKLTLTRYKATYTIRNAVKSHLIYRCKEVKNSIGCRWIFGIFDRITRANSIPIPSERYFPTSYKFNNVFDKFMCVRAGSLLRMMKNLKIKVFKNLNKNRFASEFVIAHGWLCRLAIFSSSKRFQKPKQWRIKLKYVML